MKAGFGTLFALMALAACQTPVPNSGRGVGFSDYADYEAERARREAALTGADRAQASAQNSSPNVAVTSDELAALGIGETPENSAPLSALNDETRVAANGREIGIEASPTNAAPSIANNPSISDEQDFNAVSARESIESDAERRAALAAAREQVQPTALPTRPSDTGPNIVAYALNAPNQKGQEWYSRSLLSGQSRFQRNCASYNTPDDAQRDFLARGGPERDPRGIDPDGDGFACGWDPEPFRLAAGN